MQEAADDINAQAALAGNSGSCVPVICDHADDADTEALFDQVSTEHSGRLDVLVNNACESKHPAPQHDIQIQVHMDRLGNDSNYICTPRPNPLIATTVF